MKPPSNKPFVSLRRFASQLGWRPLRVFRHRIDDDQDAPEPYVITWYESGDCGNPRTDCFLQINECPIGQAVTYAAAVYAIRYRLCTGWHPFRIHANEERQAAEVQRLRPWLHREWFDSLVKRREFRKLHPECVGYSWRQVREAGPPYEVIDAAGCVTRRCTRSGLRQTAST